ncbi:MAG TPA: universal stress protein [Burkholderiaceae bacterium]|nr:universal stress protein [Burkholderiaceae bacterium]
MSYTSLLTLIDDSPDSERRIAYAIRLAAEHGAHLTGLVAVEQVAPPAGVRGVNRMIAERYVLDRSEQVREHADRLCSAFVERAKAGGVASVDTRVAPGIPFEALLASGRYFDAVVLSRPHADLQPGEMTIDATTDLVVELGRPLLLVPQSWREEPASGQLLLAWSGTRESARALSDAMPLLQRARQVDVCLVNVDQSVNGRGEDIRALLTRHGVNAVLHHEISDLDIGNALLSRAADLGADMIVMGAFGHSPLRQQIFGGVSRSVIGSSPVPVLMSH